MVSFFGLRFGGDKKKSQGKQSDKKQSAQQQQQQQQQQQPQQQPQQWRRIDQDTLGESFNLGRPKFPPSRPGTSQSTAARNSNWRDTFKGLAATSSMVDLTASGRRPSISSLRQPAPEPKAGRPWAKSNASSTSLVLPDLFGANGLLPGIPGRPTGAKSEWASPLDVHFGKDAPGTFAGARGAATLSPLSPLSPLSRLEFGHDDDSADDFGEPGPAIITRKTGYPSPPQSIDHEEQQVQLSPINSSDLSTPSNTLGAVDRSGPASLPSPAPSAPRTSEERAEPPVIQNVQAKRDTLTFLSPRRRSFAMEIEEADAEKHRQQQNPVEGFAGNFADFDFGDSVARPAVACGTLGIELVESPIQMTEPNPFKEDRGDVRERGMSEPRETASKLPQQQQQQQSPPPQQQQYSPPQPVARPSGRPWPSPTTRLVIPDSPRRDIRGPLPVAAVSSPQEFDTTAFTQAPPKGFNSRLRSDSRSRGPPQPLRPAALSGLATRMEAATQSPRSPYGSPATNISFLEAPRPPPDRPLPERPLPARPLPGPLGSRTPLEGEFPVIKGLPRGRPLPRSSPVGQEEAQREQEEENEGNCLPLWGGFGFERSETRRSAMPAPLSPIVRQSSSPSWTSSVPSSATAPRIPSPTFPSLENAISSSSEDLARTFDISHDLPHPSPLVGEFSAYSPSASPGLRGSPMRVEAKRAPPRPTPFPLSAPSTRDRGPLTQDGARSPTRPQMQNETNFI